MVFTHVCGAPKPMHRLLIKIAVIIGALAALNIGGSWLLDHFESILGSYYQQWGIVVFFAAVALYVLLLATPFVPGVEIGWALMMLSGAGGVAIVFAATLLGLSLSFLVGRKIHMHKVVRFFGWLHFPRPQQFAEKLAALNSEAKLQLLLESAPTRILPFLLKHRYLTIAVIINLPGNSLIGGGGGIGLLAGLSHVFEYPKFLLTIALAVFPVPFVFLVRSGFLPSF